MHYSRNLIVGRDRAHVRSLLEQFPKAEVVSASAFFDKVRILAFVDDQNIKRDDHAPLIFAQSVLGFMAHENVRHAGHFASLYSSCFHGTMSPREIKNHLGDGGYSFSSVINVLAFIDEEMDSAGLVNGVGALYRSWQVIKHKKIIPPDFYHCRIHLFHLIDLTSLEIEVIKSLSHLGIVFDVRFPLDFEKRGINAAVDFSARQFEREEDLLNIDLSFENIARPGPLLELVEKLFKDDVFITLSSAHCSIDVLENISLEADHVAKKIATILTHSPNDSIAIGMRTMDTRSEIYKHALDRFHINVKDRKGIPLLNSQAGYLLQSILTAKMQALPKAEFIGLVNHPQFSLTVSDVHLRSSLIKLINEIGIDDRMIMSASPSDRMRSRLLRFTKIITSDHPLYSASQYLSEWLDQIDHLLQPLLVRNSFHGHLVSLQNVVEKTIMGDDISIDAIKNTISSLCNTAALNKNGPLLSLNDFVMLLKEELKKITIPRRENRYVDAVSFLALPELLSSSFDHVFIVDISFGRLPQNMSPHPLLSDSERIAINKLVAKNLFRIYQDDPFEPMPTPPRQALEPFWFASAIASAQKSVHFSYATFDDKNQEQAASDFFNWLKVHVHLNDEEETIEDHSAIISKQYARFLAGIHERSQNENQNNEMLIALRSRQKAFFNHETSEHAFSLGMDVANNFFGYEDDKLTKVLTPTMVEAFAQCRFKGFSERVLDVKSKTNDFDDIDARAIGQIAHRSLEKFYELSSLQKSGWKISDKTQDRLWQVLTKATKEYASTHYVANELVLSCHQEWLKDALLRLIEHLHDGPNNETSHIVGQEVAFGFSNHYPPVKITANNRSYFLGGRVDRIDRLADNFLIIDYKLSSTQRLKSSMSASALLITNFQMPIYVRLAARYFAHDNVKKINFLFASIRDGELLEENSQSENISLYERIFDDHHEKSLSQEIDRIFSPIIAGQMGVNVGEHCTRCDLTFFCRRKEVKNA